MKTRILVAAGLAAVLLLSTGCREDKRFSEALNQVTRTQAALAERIEARAAQEHFGNPAGRDLYNRTEAEFNEDPAKRPIKRLVVETSASSITDAKYTSAEMHWNQEQGIGSELGEKLPVGGYFKVTGGESSSSDPLAALGPIYDIDGRTKAELGARLIEGAHALVDTAGNHFVSLAEIRAQSIVDIITAAGEQVRGTLIAASPVGNAVAGAAPLVQAVVQRQDNGNQATGLLAIPTE